MQETIETRQKLAKAIQTLEKSGQKALIPQLVSEYKTKYSQVATEKVVPKNQNIVQSFKSALNDTSEDGQVSSPLTNFGSQIGSKISNAGVDIAKAAVKGVGKFTEKANEATNPLAKKLFGQDAVDTKNINSNELQAELVPVVDNLNRYQENITDPLLKATPSKAGEIAGDALLFTNGGVPKMIPSSVKNIVTGAGDDIAQNAKMIRDKVSKVGDKVSKVGDKVSDSGIAQMSKELVERIPRAAGKLKEKAADMSIRAKQIKTATPEIANAMKSNLDERIINTVSQADNETKKAFKAVLDIADETPKTIGAKKQPSLVGGELAVKQYDLISKQKKEVGQKIGELTKNLSKTEKLDMQDSFGQMDDIIANQGITPQYTQKGVKLNFTGSKYTPAERTKIQKLYDLAVEGGDQLTPSQIKNKDELFSKLKRESNFEGIGDLIIETPEGNKSLFNVFRDIYSSKLDTISPEVRKLNSEYRKYAQLVEDIEDSIFKTPNFNITKSVDPAEFAKVNMRRIFGEAQSSPVFEAVTDIMDKASRGLGYEGATPKQVAEFAEYIRKLYPESVPKTGFQGGIKLGVSDILEKVSTIGSPDVLDQRKALRKLLELLPKK